MSFPRHFIKLSVFTALLAVINLLLLKWTSLQAVSMASWIALIVFYILTAVSLWFILKSFKDQSANAKNMAMYVNMFLKLVVSLIAFVMLINIFPNQKQLVAIPFMLFYLLFTAFEMFLIYNLKRPNA